MHGKVQGGRIEDIECVLYAVMHSCGCIPRKNLLWHFNGGYYTFILRYSRLPLNTLRFVYMQRQPDRFQF